MDTVRLKFRYEKPNNDFFVQKIKDKEFGLADERKSRRWVYTNNTWRNEQIKQGLYIPKYWIEEDFREPEVTYFVVELSVPKFLYGHSLIELKQNDFPKLVTKLVAFSQQLGVFIFPSQIEHAVPIVFACGKNIDFTKVGTAYLAIQDLSKFNDRFRSQSRVVYFQGEGGSELIYNTKASTFKLYDKLAELKNLGKTTEEKELVERLKQGSLVQIGGRIKEMVRVELTLKKKQAVKQWLKPLVNGAPTLQAVFDPLLWDKLIEREVDRIFNHPLKDFIFLSLQQAPAIEDFLREHCKTIKTRNTMFGIINDIQQFGLVMTRQYYMETYCKATWYNYVARVKELRKTVDFTSLEKVSSVKLHTHLLRECGVTRPSQLTMDL